jgi:hypothetical protein
MNPNATFQLSCLLYVQKMEWKTEDDEPMTVEWPSRLVAWFLRALWKTLNAFANRSKQEHSQPVQPVEN